MFNQIVKTFILLILVVSAVACQTSLTNENTPLQDNELNGVIIGNPGKPNKPKALQIKTFIPNFFDKFTLPGMENYVKGSSTGAFFERIESDSISPIEKDERRIITLFEALNILNQQLLESTSIPGAGLNSEAYQTWSLPQMDLSILNLENPQLIFDPSLNKKPFNQFLIQSSKNQKYYAGYQVVFNQYGIPTKGALVIANPENVGHKDYLLKIDFNFSRATQRWLVIRTVGLNSEKDNDESAMLMLYCDDEVGSCQIQQSKISAEALLRKLGRNRFYVEYNDSDSDICWSTSRRIYHNSNAIKLSLNEENTTELSKECEINPIFVTKPGKIKNLLLYRYNDTLPAGGDLLESFRDGFDPSGFVENNPLKNRDVLENP